MTRRRFLAAIAAALAFPAAAHTPYRQWKVLRERFLLVHSTRTDPAGDALAEKLVAILKEVLPQANAMAARAPNEQRIASLLTTGQAMLAVMRPADARNLFLTREEFRDFQGAQLRLLLEVENHVLATVDAFPRHHGWLVASALVEYRGELRIAVPEAGGEVPVHTGATAFKLGEPLEKMQ